jgi:GNAT superfamily N-acetyltransferase
MQIRSATAGDVESVMTLLRGQFEEHGIVASPDTLREAVRVLASDPARGAILVAFDPDAVGLAVLPYTWTLEHGGLVGWLEELYVVPSRRSQGVGSMLLERALDLARLRGCRAIDLEVDSGHARAEHLYRRAGFKLLPRRRWTRVLRESSGVPGASAPASGSPS